MGGFFWSVDARARQCFHAVRRLVGVATILSVSFKNIVLTSDVKAGITIALYPVTDGRIRSIKMLSHVVNLVKGYETDFGQRPNLLYMNETHYGYLREEMPGVWDHNDVVSLLGIDIALSDEAIQPHVATVTYCEENILVS